MMKKSFLLISATGAFLLSGCVSDFERNIAYKVITSLPQEVEGCEFIADVDTTPRATVNNARFDLKLQAAKLGATHVVETHAYAAPIGLYFSPDIGVALSGRAYICPEGIGPKIYEGPRIPGAPRPALSDKN